MSRSSDTTEAEATLLKVGELARRSGVTVRTLHHYDSIGLLHPSGRSEGGYRLYNRADVARLHGIQVLRSIGLPLEQIGAMLSREGAGLAVTVARQLSVLDHQIEQATRLRDRLALVQAKFQEDGGEPELTDWLDTLQLMSACDQYFSAAETKQIFENWSAVESQLTKLVGEVKSLMAEGVPATDPRVQPFAQRWANLMYTWMRGDYDLMERWGQMYLAEPRVHTGPRPNLGMIQYIEQAVQLRIGLMCKYMSMDDLKRLGPVADAEWASFTAEVLAVAAQKPAPDAPAVQALLKRWHEIRQRACRGDPALDAKLQRAYRNEPLLRDTMPLVPAAREFLWRMAEAQPGGERPPEGPHQGA
ncbi:MAG: MerR family transcriptional regulator [Burkholderiales bacterium]|nr:MerR family transcriptional regulator [Burkholderiales bacterium]